MLAPGDRVTKLVERALIEQADAERVEELAEIARVGGVIAGQMVALSLGADTKSVSAIALALLGGETDGE